MAHLLLKSIVFLLVGTLVGSGGACVMLEPIEGVPSEENKAPEIMQMEPEGEWVHRDLNYDSEREVDFSVTVRDPNEGDALRAYWYIDDDERPVRDEDIIVGVEGVGWTTYPPLSLCDHEGGDDIHVRVVIRDHYDVDNVGAGKVHLDGALETSHTWYVVLLGVCD